MARQTNQTTLSYASPTFDESFMHHHAGQVINDPFVAIVELIANCSDAGADKVEITWPDEPGDSVVIRDNGIGMTADEFRRRWSQFNYNRRVEQGIDVKFPAGVKKRARRPFGRNGIGRHAAFYFGPAYTVETCKDQQRTTFRVTRSHGTASTPFAIEHLRQEVSAPDASGTTITVECQKVLPSATTVQEAIGSRFIADPDFKLYMNGHEIRLTDLERQKETFKVEVGRLGTFEIHRFEAERTHRTSAHHGVAFWVANKLCGTPSWEIIPGDSANDRRNQSAKKFTYVVIADALHEHVKPDWSGFHPTPEVQAFKAAIDVFVRKNLHEASAATRREKKRQALKDNSTSLASLSNESRQIIAKFTEEILDRCPTIEEDDLTNAVAVLASLENAKTGYNLLERMAALGSDNLDELDRLLDEWSVSDMRRALDELDRRLKLIANLERMTANTQADELHDLQPLFEHGLWIFGPEFESLHFMSNRALSTIVKEMFGAECAYRENARRPDFVALPDSSIGVYSRDSFAESREVDGYGEIVIVELKRAGVTVSTAEKNQAADYARRIRSKGNIRKDVRITAYVLGSEIDPEDADVRQEGNNFVMPLPYSVVLRKAHARTFHLMGALKDRRTTPEDADLNELFAQGSLAV